MATPRALPRRIGFWSAAARLVGTTIGSGIFPSPAGVAYRLPAFLFGWAELVIIRAAALGAIATTFAEYALRAAGYDPKVGPYDGGCMTQRRRRSC